MPRKALYRSVLLRECADIISATQQPRKMLKDDQPDIMLPESVLPKWSGLLVGEASTNSMICPKESLRCSGM